MARNRGAKLIRRTKEWKKRYFDKFVVDIPEDKSLLRRLRIFGSSEIDGNKILGVGSTDKHGNPCLKIKFHGYCAIGGRELFEVFRKYAPGSFEYDPSGEFVVAKFHEEKFRNVIIMHHSTDVKFKSNTDYYFFIHTRYDTAKMTDYLNIRMLFADKSSHDILMTGFVNKTDFSTKYTIQPKRIPVDLQIYRKGSTPCNIYLDRFGFTEINPKHSSVAFTPYVEKIEDIATGDYLHGIGKICDEADIVLGVLKRKLNKLILDGTTPFEMSDTEGVFSLKLDIPAKPGSEMLAAGLQTIDKASLLAGEYGVALDDDGCSILLRSEIAQNSEELNRLLESQGAELLYIRANYVTEPISCPIPAAEEFVRVAVMSVKEPSKLYSEYA